MYSKKHMLSTISKFDEQPSCFGGGTYIFKYIIWHRIKYKNKIQQLFSTWINRTTNRSYSKYWTIFLYKHILTTWCLNFLYCFLYCICKFIDCSLKIMRGSSRGPGLEIFILATRIRIPYPVQDWESCIH